ncbi:MAG TPA: helix-turn-helix transcriptional regulator [Solirubrobacteraceae bacterium]|jgi:DNA-binding CsgD family transcriptional regulator|nr:helix-turn-helix transcriptional regulator [Solirubrobacteraceae bacterium]
MTTDTLAAAHEALRTGAWDEARVRFQAAVEAAPSGEAYEGLGWAGYWLADEELTLDARERAFRAYRAEGDRAGAGRVAAWLASDHLEFRGDDAVARGWLERAHRLLDDVVPEREDHGWLALHEGSYAMNVSGDLDRAAALAQRGAAIGRALGPPDLEAVGLALEGFTYVRRGRVEAGMRLLDEASAIARGEDLRMPIAEGWALCYLISACEGVGDFPRAAQWCQAVRSVAEDWGGRHLVGICRSAYGNVLATNGDWEAAELELTGAVGDLQRSRPGMAAGGLARLGELRVRQGRVDEARVLFTQAGAHLRAIVGLGLLALEAGDPAGAADGAERALRRAPAASLLDRLPALDLLVRARAALGELDAAADAYAELERAAAELATPYVEGRARLAAGRLAAARGDHESARRAFEDAVDLLVEAAAAYEAALARLELSGALAALGRDQPAAAEEEAGRAALAALGAREPARVASAERRALNELTPRELEILQLVAQGLNDAEIAERLVLSQHTVHRHVANVRTKLRLPSRTAAVAYAARAGLL